MKDHGYQTLNMKTHTQQVEIEKEKYLLFELKNGGTGIADFKYQKIVEDATWRWSNKGIVSYDGDQLVLLHNMIAPYDKVSFKNGLKWDCRRENLVDHRGLEGVPTRVGKNIYDSTSLYKYCVHRKVIINSHKYWFFTSYSYKIKDKKEALRKATETRDFIFSMSKEEFIKWKNERPQHKSTYNDMINDYSAFKGREITKDEVAQSGMSHKYDYRDSIQ